MLPSKLEHYTPWENGFINSETRYPVWEPEDIWSTKQLLQNDITWVFWSNFRTLKGVSAIRFQDVFVNSNAIVMNLATSHFWIFQTSAVIVIHKPPNYFNFLLLSAFCNLIISKNFNCLTNQWSQSVGMHNNHVSSYYSDTLQQ